MSIDITQIINAVIALLAAIVTAFLVPWLKAKLGETNYQTTTSVIKMLVTAAEQLYTGSGRGEEKLQYVIEQLKQRGYTVDRAAIEAQVKALFNSSGTEETKEE